MRCKLIAVALLLVLAPAPLRACFRRSCEKNLQLRVGKYHAADVAPFHHHAALLAGAALLGHQHLAHAGIHSDLRSCLGNFGRANRGGHVVVVEEHALRAVFRAQVNSRLPRQRHQFIVMAIKRQAVPQRLKRQRAVHRSRIHVHVAEKLGDATR